MADTILITGPSLAPAAANLLVEAGYTPVYVPAYTTGEGLIAAVRDADPAGILARMGRVDEAVFQVAPKLRVQDLDTLFATSNIVSLHSPLTPATRHAVNSCA